MRRRLSIVPSSPPLDPWKVREEALRSMFEELCAEFAARPSPATLKAIQDTAGAILVCHNRYR